MATPTPDADRLARMTDAELIQGAADEARRRRAAADELVESFILAMEKAAEAVNRSVLDGTVTCRECYALVLEQSELRHMDWHNGIDRCTKCGRSGHTADRC